MSGRTYELTAMVYSQGTMAKIVAHEQGYPDQQAGPWPWTVQVFVNGSSVGSWPTHARSWTEAMCNVAEYVIGLNPQWDQLVVWLKALIEPLVKSN